MNIARIDESGIVVNIEVATQEWLDQARAITNDLLIPYTDEQPARIGYGWSPDTGFEQPPMLTQLPEGA